MELLVFPLLAFAPGLFWLWFFARRGVYRHGPRRLLAFTFLSGMASTIPAGIINTAFVDESILSGLASTNLASVATGMLFVVGPVEESSKFLAVLLLAYHSPYFGEPGDGLVYSAAASLGFASLENLLYVLMFGPSVMIGRAPLSTAAHVVFGSFWGYALGRQVRANRSGSDGRVDFKDPCRSNPPTNGVKGVDEGDYVYLTGCALGAIIAIHPRGEPDNIVRVYTIEIYAPTRRKTTNNRPQPARSGSSARSSQTSSPGTGDAQKRTRDAWERLGGVHPPKAGPSGRLSASRLQRRFRMDVGGEALRFDLALSGGGDSGGHPRIWGLNPVATFRATRIPILLLGYARAMASPSEIGSYILIPVLRSQRPAFGA